jgi:hypothetical protein
LSQCNFQQWDRGDSGAPALDMRAGSLIAQGNIFRRDRADVHLGPEVRSAVIMGNQFAGEARIRNDSKGDVQILGNVTTE